MIFTTVANQTEKEYFMELIKENKVSINKINDNTYKLCDDRFNHLEWNLEVEDNIYILSCKDIYQEFKIYLTMNKELTTINKAWYNGKTYKSEKFLKKYNQLMVFANSFVNFGLLN